MRPILLLPAIAIAIAGCAASGTKEIKITADENGFTPKTVTVSQGEPVVLVITRTSDATCATEAIFTETGKRYELPKDQPVRVDLPTGTKGTLHFACGMDMYKGEVVID